MGLRPGLDRRVRCLAPAVLLSDGFGPVSTRVVFGVACIWPARIVFFWGALHRARSAG